MPPQDSASGTLGEVELRPNRLEVDRLLDDPRTRIIVCCGSGGVGKTTTAAALGLRAAERGQARGGADGRSGAAGWPSRWA